MNDTNLRDTFISCVIISIACMSAVFGVASFVMPLWRQAESLKRIATELSSIDQAIKLQTAQQSWLASHYMNPVRPLYPWEKHRCEWCGQEKQEGGDE